MSRKWRQKHHTALRTLPSMRPRQKCLGNGMPRMVMISQQPASMGPRQKCLGNLAKSSCVMPWASLQWGRDKNVSEIHLLPVRPARLAIASMGPRQKCLGNQGCHRSEVLRHFASMGPRQKCLGNRLERMQCVRG